MTNVRSRFNDWMFKVLLFLVPFLFVPLLSVRVSAAITDTSGNPVTVTAEFSDATGSDKTKITYDGSAHGEDKIDLTFTAGNSQLNPAPVKDTDYTVSWSQTKAGETTPMTTPDFTSAGTLTGTITTKAGSIFTTANQTETVTLTIEQKPLTDGSITVDNIDDVTYDGTAKEPTVTVKDDSKTLTKDNDYTVEYENNTNAETATVKINGRGNYAGTKTVTFNISARSLENDGNVNVTWKVGETTLQGNSITYDGTDKTPIPTVKFTPSGGSEIYLTSDKEYTVAYYNEDGTTPLTAGQIVNAQKIKVTITGNGNYSDSVKKDFEITPATAILSEVKASDIIYGQTLSNSTISGIAKKADETQIDGTFSFKDVDPSTTKPEMDDTLNPKDFSKSYNVKFKSNDGNYEGTSTVTLNVHYWGTMKTENGTTYWVDSNGMTSTQVKENGISWLKEESNNKLSAWYGLENPKKDDGAPLFEPGSRFWVRWISSSDPDWDDAYKTIDDKYKQDVDSGRLYVFYAGVTNPNGQGYIGLDPNANLYIQISSDWGEDDKKAVRILSGDADDIEVEASFVASSSLTDCPVTDGKFAKLSLNHFSLFGVYDPVSASPKNENNSNKNTTTISDLADLFSTGSSNKGTSSSDTTSSYGLGSSLYKSTGEAGEENAYLIPMFLPILLFVLIYEKKRLNKIL